MQLVGDSVDEATRRVVQDLWRDGGIGGVIALDEQGKGTLKELVIHDIHS